MVTADYFCNKYHCNGYVIGYLSKSVILALHEAQYIFNTATLEVQPGRQLPTQVLCVVHW